MPTAGPRTDDMNIRRSVALLPPDQRRCFDAYCFFLRRGAQRDLSRDERACVASYLHGAVLFVFKFTPSTSFEVETPALLQGSAQCVAGKACHNGEQATFVVATNSGMHPLGLTTSFITCLKCLVFQPNC